MIWPLWILDIENAFLHAGDLDREVFLRAPREWNSQDTRRVWQMQTATYGLNDAPAAFHQPLRRYVANSAESLPIAKLRLEVSSFDPCMYFISRETVEAVGAIATHPDDISGCGEPELLRKERSFCEQRFGKLGAREGPVVHLGMELGQEKGFFAPLTREDIAKYLKLVPTPPALRA